MKYSPWDAEKSRNTMANIMAREMDEWKTTNLYLFRKEKDILPQKKGSGR